MAKKNSETSESRHTIDALHVRSSGATLQLLALSHREFQARWSLSKELIESGSRAASANVDELRLVLRTYALPLDSDDVAFSSNWHDYSIDKHHASSFFRLPKPSPKINAAIGLINKSGRFTPLVHGDAVALPPLPPPPPERQSKQTEQEAPRGRNFTYQSKPVHAALEKPAQ